MLRAVLVLLPVLLLPAAVPDPAPAAAALNRRELRVGLETGEPPFSFVGDDGDFHGFNADISRALCARIEVRCSFVPVTISEAVQQLQNRAVDLVPSLSITEGRRETVDFTDRYYVSPTRFIARRNAIPDTSPTGLAGKVVGVHRGTTQDRYVTTMYPGSVLRRHGDTMEVFVDLALGRIDAVLTNVVAGRAQFLETELGADFDFVGPTLDDPKWFGAGIGIAVRKGDEDLRATLNGALREIRADGTFDAIRSQYFSFPID